MADFKINGSIFKVEESDIKTNMKEFSLNREDAVRMYFEDLGLIEPANHTKIEEVAEVKQKRHYVKSDKPRKQSERVRKVDEVKKGLLALLMKAITDENIEITSVKNEAEFNFTSDGVDYSVKLIKHRPKKADGA